MMEAKVALCSARLQTELLVVVEVDAIGVLAACAVM